MKALIILSHLRSPFFLATYLYGENELLWGPLLPFGVFSWENTRPVSRELICKEDTFTKLSLFKIMKYGQSDVERQISTQSIHLSAFWNYFWKRKGSFKFYYVYLTIFTGKLMLVCLLLVTRVCTVFTYNSEMLYSVQGSPYYWHLLVYHHTRCHCIWW